MANCFKASWTFSIGMLSSLDKTVSLSFSSLPQCSTIQNSSILCSAQVNHCLPARWSETLLFLFPKLWGDHGEKPLPILTVDSTAAQHNKNSKSNCWPSRPCRNNFRCCPWNSRAGHLLNLVPSVHFPVYPQSSTDGPNHTHSPRTDWFPGNSGTLKPMGPRSFYS